MSLSKPTCKVEWTTNFSAWNDISGDVVDFEVSVEDLLLGAWSFILHLNNKAGKYDATFPSIDGEAGLHYGFRFTINDKVLGVFRANNLTPHFDDVTGDVLLVTGLGLGHEAFNKLCVAKEYPRYRADEIVQSQSSMIGFADLLVTLWPYTAPRHTVFIPHSGRQSFRELIVELEDAAEFSAYFDSRQHLA